MFQIAHLTQKPTFDLKFCPRRKDGGGLFDSATVHYGMEAGGNLDSYWYILLFFLNLSWLNLDSQRLVVGLGMYELTGNDEREFKLLLHP